MTVKIKSNVNCMGRMYETHDEYPARLDEMIRIGKLKIEYKNILLEIAELHEQACTLGLIFGSGWREDANHNVIDEYEIYDREGNLLHLTLAEARSYLQNLIIVFVVPVWKIMR